MNFLSVFSGIEAASVAFEPLGWKCIAVAEIEKFPCQHLKHHYPDVPNLGDVMADDFLDRVRALSPRPRVVIGGPPCQDYSVAGLRAGLEGTRGNLTLRHVEIIHAARPDYAITENVPGWLSANKGLAFGTFLAKLVGSDTALIPPKQCGGRWTDAGMVAGPGGRAAWRILDAQYFDLAQRRNRVFVVFCPAGGADPAEILFERKSLHGNSPPRREKRKDIAGAIARSSFTGGAGGRPDGAAAGHFQVAPTLPARTKGGGGMGTDFDCDGGLIAMATGQGGADPINTDFGPSLTCNHEAPIVAQTLRGEGFDASEDGTGRQNLIIDHGIDDTMVSNGDAHSGFRDEKGLVPVAFTQNSRDEVRLIGGDGQIIGALAAEAGMKQQSYVAVGVSLRGREEGGTAELSGEVMPAKRASQGGGDKPHVLTFAVRRLMPEECEILQGFPIGHTKISDKTADGPRYKAIGNSKAVNVVRWIGKRIAMVDKIT